MNPHRHSKPVKPTFFLHVPTKQRDLFFCTVAEPASAGSVAAAVVAAALAVAAAEEAGGVTRVGAVAAAAVAEAGVEGAAALEDEDAAPGVSATTLLALDADDEAMGDSVDDASACVDDALLLAVGVAAAGAAGAALLGVEAEEPRSAGGMASPARFVNPA
jgi:hypothetical protein